jgi:hypothetical protein
LKIGGWRLEFRVTEGCDDIIYFLRLATTTGQYMSKMPRGEDEGEGEGETHAQSSECI